MQRKKSFMPIQALALLIAFSLQLAYLPLQDIYAQTESYPNLPQPKFQDIAPTPKAETGSAGGGGGAPSAQSGSTDAGGIVGGVIGNAISGAAQNSVGGLVGNAVTGGAVPGPTGTAVGDTQLAISFATNITTGLLTILGISLAVTGPLALAGFAIAVVVGLTPTPLSISMHSQHTGPATGESESDTSLSPADANIAAQAEHGEAEPGSQPASEPGAQPSSDTSSSSCFRAGTYVATGKIGEKFEYKKIEDLQVDDLVMGIIFDASGNPRLYEAKVLRVFQHEKQSHPFAKLTTADGITFEGTTNHKIIVDHKNDSVPIGDLKTNTPVIAFSSAPLWNKVSVIRLLPPEPEVPVFNLGTETHNYLISQDGIHWLLVHNGGGGEAK